MPSELLRSLPNAPGLAALSRQPVLAWGLLVLVASLLGLLVLPGLGRAELMSPLMLFFLGAGGYLGVWYLKYLRWVLSRPADFLLMLLFSFDLFAFTFGLLETTLGVSLKITTLSTAVYYIPLMVMIAVHWKGFQLLRVPAVGGFLAFMAVSALYYVVHNAQAMDLHFKIGNDYSPIHWTRLYALFSMVLMTTALSTYLQRLPRLDGFFERFNRVLLIFMAIISVLAIVFYPFGILTEFIETTRMALFFRHPNVFSHYLSLASCYLLAIGFYKLKQGAASQAKAYFWVVPVVVLAQCTAGSKTSLFTTLGSLALVVILEVVFNRTRFKLLKGRQMLLFAGFSAVLIGLLSFLNVFQNFEQRLNDNGSFTWRLIQYQRVMNHVDPDRLLLGHGHTAALTETQRFVHNDWNLRENLQESMFVHNAFLESLYDYGCLGLTWIIGIALAVFASIRPLCSRGLRQPARLSLHIGSLGMLLVQGVGWGFNEIFYIVSPLSFWFCWVLLFTVATAPDPTPSVEG